MSGPDDRRCPCGLGEPYDACCGRFHTGRAASTPEQVMRARYSAFALGRVDYLLRTWHPATRPADAAHDPTRRWTHLEVLARDGGGLGTTTGTVTFRAHSRQDGRRHVMQETSSFVRLDDGWVYVGPA